MRTTINSLPASAAGAPPYARVFLEFGVSSDLASPRTWSAPRRPGRPSRKLCSLCAAASLRCSPSVWRPPNVYAGARQPDTISAEDPRIVPLQLDVAEAAQIADAAAQAVDVQVLVTNAGVTAVQPLLDATDPRGAEMEMPVNYFGALWRCVGRLRRFWRALSAVRL